MCSAILMIMAVAVYITLVLMAFSAGGPPFALLTAIIGLLIMSGGYSEGKRQALEDQEKRKKKD